MNELNLPDFLPQQVKDRMLADKDFILKFRELAATLPEWNTLTFAEKTQRARSALL